MPHPVSYVPPGCILLPPKRVFTALPPPPPPAGFYKEYSPPLRTHWPPVMCGPPPPPPPLAIPVRLQQKSKKLICIQDPSTGQDITQQILHSSPTNASIPNFTPAGSPPNPMMMKVCSPPEISWYEPPCRPEIYSSSAPCLCFGPAIGPWPPRIPFSNGSTGSNGRCRLQYDRDYLLSLRYHPLSVKVPPGLPDLSLLCRNKSPSPTAHLENDKSKGVIGCNPDKEKRSMIFRSRSRTASTGDVNGNNRVMHI